MRIAYLDCFSGISGDMFLGALIDAGVSAELLEQTVAALNVGARLELSRVVRGGIAGTKVDVLVHGEKDLPREEFWAQHTENGGHSHSGRHAHQDHAHPHSHSEESKSAAQVDLVSNADKSTRATAATHSHEYHGRGLREIRGIIRAAGISESAKKTAIAIFEALGKAEAEIHDTTLDAVHFHEVGAVDAMVDIVCAAVGAEALEVNEWVCSPLNVGSGTVKCAHGILPVPAPATMKLLAGAPVYSAGPQVELVTPTGAAIVKTLVTRFGALPPMKMGKSGYGAGSRDFADLPNLVRLTIGKQFSANDVPAQGVASQGALAASNGISSDRVTVLEANLDDLSPQVLAYAMERLLEEGALDVFSAPVQMKKNRPAALLTVLTKPADAERLTKVIFAETSTLGVRRRDEARRVLDRRWETVETSWGPVRIKIANMNGTVSNYAPEFEDCRRIASEHHVPLKSVMQEATQLYLRDRRKN
ncbi:MAG TPA: nickel pincer cofactor biosynthesis protein LarC [Terriglobales bacterium]|nr:nickel pincer cofactor biosynthesis protein LarC [Terriglobales bacterium]